MAEELTPAQIRQIVWHEEWDYARAAIERAFEVYGNASEQPQYYHQPLKDAAQAVRHLTQRLHSDPDLAQEHGQHLLLKAAVDGLVRAEKIERMLQVTNAAAERAPQAEMAHSYQMRRVG